MQQEQPTAPNDWDLKLPDLDLLSDEYPEFELPSIEFPELIDIDLDELLKPIEAIEFGDKVKALSSE